MGKLENVVMAGKSGAGKQPRVDVLVQEFALTQPGRETSSASTSAR